MTFPTLTDLLASRFLKKEDFEKPALLTIAKFERENVAPDNQAAEWKWVLYFDELDRGIVLNKTNAALLPTICGTTDPAQWIGKKVVAFTDPTVSFAGRITGGIRLRAPKQPQAAARPAQSATAKAAARPAAAAPMADLEDDVPWEREPGDEVF